MTCGMRRSAVAAVFMLFAVSPALANADVGLRKVGDFSAPVHVAGAPGDDSRLYVVEQRGTVRVVRNGAAGLFVDLTAAVEHDGEQGLLSMAFAPDFATSRKLYVYFTEKGGQANRVEELRAPTGDAVDPASRRLVISIPHTTADNHNGGQLQFGPDGYLYLAPGDGGETPAAARDLDSLLGKLLRIDPRGGGDGEYALPSDNPFAGQAGRRGEIWAYGLRNPFRFSFDRLTGDLMVGDVGEGTTEEITHLRAAGGGGRGADLGWDVCEGRFMTGGISTPCGLAESVLPAIEWHRTDGYRSIIAGYVVRDPSLPSLIGRFVYGDFFVDRLRSAVLGPGGAADDREIGAAVEVDRLSSFGEDAAGCVYAMSLHGPVYRLVENDTAPTCASSGAGRTPATPGGSRRGLSLRSSVRPRQRVARLRGVVARVRCDRRCRVTAKGVLRIGKRSFRLRSVRTRMLPANQRARVKLALGPRARRALRRAWRTGSGSGARVRMSLHAVTAAGERSRTLRHTVRVRRG